jgi:hypothetical protein
MAGVRPPKPCIRRNLEKLDDRLLVSLVLRWTAPSPALTGISRVTLGQRDELAIQRMSDTARLRRNAHAKQDSLERFAA